MRYITKKVFIIICLLSLCFPNNVYASETYYSELTGMPVSSDIKNQRPIAVMMDNEEKALPHGSLSKADIVYEMMNSTANGRITRLMCLYKDYQNIDQIGSVRSVRTTHIPIAAEYDAILIHEGGPEIYITTPLANDWATHLNGGFSRLQNGKAKEFTEFVLTGEVKDRAQSVGLSLEYGNNKPVRDFHFNFGTNDLTAGMDVNSIDMSAAYPHTKSALLYNNNTNKYEYYTYGQLQKDKDTGDIVAFDNVIIQITPFSILDENGYMFYSVIGKGNAFYLSNGKCIDVYWKKESATGLTKYYNKNNGEELLVNPGKTYINVYPEPYFASLLFS